MKEFPRVMYVHLIGWIMQYRAPRVWYLPHPRFLDNHLLEVHYEYVLEKGKVLETGRIFVCMTMTTQSSCNHLTLYNVLSFLSYIHQTSISQLLFILNHRLSGGHFRSDETHRALYLEVGQIHTLIHLNPWTTPECDEYHLWDWIWMRIYSFSNFDRIYS